jgi:hypothetical protein
MIHTIPENGPKFFSPEILKNQEIFIFIGMDGRGFQKR